MPVAGEASRGKGRDERPPAYSYLFNSETTSLNSSPSENPAISSFSPLVSPHPKTSGSFPLHAVDRAGRVPPAAVRAAPPHRPPPPAGRPGPRLRGLPATVTVRGACGEGIPRTSRAGARLFAPLPSPLLVGVQGYAILGHSGSRAGRPAARRSNSPSSPVSKPMLQGSSTRITLES